MFACRTKAQEQLLEAAPSAPNGGGGSETASGGGDSHTEEDNAAAAAAAAAAATAAGPFELARELYTLTFRDESFPVFGCSYELRLTGQPAASGRKEYLVHFPTLINIAREYGLEMVRCIYIVTMLSLSLHDSNHCSLHDSNDSNDGVLIAGVNIKLQGLF